MATVAERSTEKSSDLIWSQTYDLPACTHSTISQPTILPRAIKLLSEN
jgi:hypothetical protein